LATLTVRDIQTDLNISQPAAYALVNQKGFPAINISDCPYRKKYRIDKDKYEAWKEKGGFK